MAQDSYYARNKEKRLAYAKTRKKQQIEINKQFKSKNPNYQKNWIANHRDLQNGYASNWKKRNPIKYKFKSIRESARRRGIEFSITYEEFSQIDLPTHCPILGIELKFYCGTFSDHTPWKQTKETENSYSLDRIDSNKGYIIDNVRWISLRANKLMNDASIQELEQILAFKKQ